MEGSKVSIVIPVYNVEEFLDECILSVVNQTYKNLEIILVDDGSPDACPQICDKWAKKDERIKVIHQTNKGVSAARNAALDIMTGDYVCFVDSDDSLNQHYVEILLKTTQKYGSDITACSWKKIKNTNKVKKAKNYSKKFTEKVFENDEVFDLIYNKQVPLIMALWTKIYKADLFKEIRFPSLIVAEDDAILHLLLNKCKKFVFIDCQLYYYTQRANSLTTSTFKKKKLHALEVFKDRISFVEKNKPAFKDRSIHHYLRILILYYYYARWSKMEKEILTAIKSEIDLYCSKGYESKLTRMFNKFPNVLNIILKIRQRII